MGWKGKWFDDWNDGFYFAQKQAITGTVFEEIEKMSPNIPDMPEMLLFQWIGTTEQIKQQNNIVNNEVEALARLLDGQGIRYAVVKGQVVASYYEKPEYRQSGDIDFYVPKEDADRAKEVIEKEWHVEMDKGDSAKHFDFKHNGITFEMHFRLFEWYQEKREKYWHENLNGAMNHRVRIGDTQVATLKPTVHAFYVFIHLYHHLIELGVGLRQFCDLAAMLRTDIDCEELRMHLKVLGMTRAFRACEYIISEKLDLPKEYLPYNIRGIDKWFGRSVLDIVLYRGNMGHYNKRSGFHGWKHKAESLGIKVSHFMKLWWLAPNYHMASLKHKLLG